MAFDYKEFLAENKLTKVSKGRETGKAQILSEGIQICEDFNTETDDLDEGHKCPKCGQDPCVCECDALDMMEANKQKEDYLKRKEREAEGNWKGSVGAFVETHGEELGKAATNRQALVDYIENVMKPELNDEAKEYVDNLVATIKSPYKLLMSLYNATLKGSGLGLNEEDDMSEENLMEMAMNHSSLGGERHRKKPGAKPGTANQDKMAKSEMKGDKIKVTMKDGTVKYMTKAQFTRYKNELKAKKTIKEGMEGGLEGIFRALYNQYGKGTYSKEITIHLYGPDSFLGKDDEKGCAVINTNEDKTNLGKVCFWKD